MPAVKNLIHETSTTTGTGNFTTVAVNGKVRFSDTTYGFGTGGTNVFDYFISNRDAAEWERGTGHMPSAGTLVRDTVIESSNANAAVSFSAGTKDVTNDVPAAKQAPLDIANSWAAAQTFINSSGIKILDTDASHALGIVGGSNLTAARTLTLTTGDASRVLTMTGDASITGTNTGDQTDATNASNISSGTLPDARLGATVVQSDVSQALTVGYTITPNNLGNITNFTVDPALGNLQYGTNHGAATWTAPASDCIVNILVTNDASAGAITFSGFTVGSSTGDVLTTTNTQKFLISIFRINAVSTYLVKALQ